MARIKIDAMGGMRPLIDPRQLPDQSAAFCSNVIVRTGALLPMSLPVEIFRWVGKKYPSARRLRFNDGSTFFYPLQSVDSDILKGPLLNDAYERYYILDPPGTPLRYNTKARILAGDPSYLLGIPAPTPAPTVGHTGGSSPTQGVRAYIYTYVDAFGQEGAPSDATVHTAPIDATSWDLSGMATTIPNASERPAVSKKIYRTQVADGGAVAYKYIATIPLTQATYTDTITDEQAALNYSLATLNYMEPLVMDGIVQMPGGFIVGWKGRDLHFSEPYKPWAWPAEYDLALEYQIVGAGVIQQTLAVGTRGNPYTLTGNTPAAMTPSKQDRFEPCISRRSVIGGIDAVFYASENGLMAVNAGGTQDMTKAIIGRERWQRDYATTIYGAGRVAAYYMALNNKDKGTGFMFATDDVREAVIRLQDFQSVQSLWDDCSTDDIMGNYYEGADTVVLRMTPRDTINTGTPRVYSWRSKEFFLAQPTNFAVYQINADAKPMSTSEQDLVAGVSSASHLSLAAFDMPGDGVEVRLAAEPPDAAEQHARMALSSKVGMTGIGLYGAYIAEAPTTGVTPPGTESPAYFGWPWWPGVNGNEGRVPDYDLTIPEGEVGVVYFFANRVTIYKENLQPNVQMRLPSGFRSSTWQILVVAKIPIYSIDIATHGRELLSV